MDGDSEIEPREVARYLREIADELMRLAQSAGMPGTAAALELARQAAEREAGQDLKAEPDSAA